MPKGTTLPVPKRPTMDACRALPPPPHHKASHHTQLTHIHTPPHRQCTHTLRCTSMPTQHLTGSAHTPSDVHPCRHSTLAEGTSRSAGRVCMVAHATGAMPQVAQVPRHRCPPSPSCVPGQAHKPHMPLPLCITITSKRPRMIPIAPGPGTHRGGKGEELGARLSRLPPSTCSTSPGCRRQFAATPSGCCNGLGRQHGVRRHLRARVDQRARGEILLRTHRWCASGACLHVCAACVCLFVCLLACCVCVCVRVCTRRRGCGHGCVTYRCWER